MGKIITVWGSPGSGKSMFCCILAKALTQDKKKAIIISADSEVPMYPIWLPGQMIEPKKSISKVFSAEKIDETLIAEKVTVSNDYPFIGLIGCTAGEDLLFYETVTENAVLQMIAAARKLVDFVILDCSSYMRNPFHFSAIENCDKNICILTPDRKGASYKNAYQLYRKRQDRDQIVSILLAGMARPYHEIETIGYMVGGFDGILPYQKRIDRHMTDGSLFDAIRDCNSDYLASLHLVRKQIGEIRAL